MPVNEEERGLGVEVEKKKNRSYLACQINVKLLVLPRRKERVGCIALLNLS